MIGDVLRSRGDGSRLMRKAPDTAMNCQILRAWNQHAAHVVYRELEVTDTGPIVLDLINNRLRRPRRNGDASDDFFQKQPSPLTVEHPWMPWVQMVERLAVRDIVLVVVPRLAALRVRRAHGNPNLSLPTELRPQIGRAHV